jgi:hypothetical protein
MALVGISQYMPDMPDLPASGSDRIENVLPLTTISYGPMPSHRAYSSALAARCQGGMSVIDLDGNVRTFAGTASKLYRFSPPGTTPQDVSKAGTYAVAVNWAMDVFGNRIVATNGNDPIQSYREGTDTLFSDMILTGETSIRAKYVASVRDWVVLGNTYDGTYGKCPQRVWWSAINNPTNFPTPGTQAAITALSDYQDVVGDHGALMGLAGNLGTAHCAVFFERAVWRMNYVGLPAMFDFVAAEGARGLLAPGGLCQFGAIAYYIGEDGFYAFDGSNSTPIGKGRVDKFFYSDFNSNYLDRICCSVDPTRGLIFWAYPGTGSSNGVCNRLLCYSPAFDRWTISDATSFQIEWLFRTATFGKTLEDLNAFGSLDSLAFSLDSQVWLGGRSVLGGMNSSHQLGYFDGPNLPATLDTSDIEVVPGYQSTVTRVRPMIDLANPIVAGCGRDRISGAKVFGPNKSVETNGSASMRTRGRYHRYRVQTQLGDDWSQFSGVDIEEAAQVGKR